MIITDPDTISRLVEAARNHVMTPEERRAQRASWVYGQMRYYVASGTKPTRPSSLLMTDALDSEAT